MALNAVGCGMMSRNSTSHIAGLGAVDEDRSGQGMHEIGVDMCEIGDGRVGADLAVERVAGFERHFLALGNLEDRGNVGVIAVVASMRFGGEGLVPVDTDDVHRGTHTTKGLANPTTTGVWAST